MMELIGQHFPRHIPPPIMHDKIYVYLTIGQILNLDEKQGLWDARINFYSRYFLPENVWYGNGSNFPECILVPQGTAWGPTLSMKSSLFSSTLILGWQGAPPPPPHSLLPGSKCSLYVSTVSTKIRNVSTVLTKVGCVLTFSTV